MPSRFLRPALRGFHAYVPGFQPPDGEGWIKLNTNESPWPPSSRVLEAIAAATGESLRLYPSPTAAAAREAIASQLGLDPAMVALGNGGDELLAMAIRAFAGPGATVAFPWPSYPLYEPASRLQDAIPVAHPLDRPGPAGWALPDALIADPSPLKFVANPNSPTGTLFAAARIEELAEASAGVGVVVLDEAYVDFAPRSGLDLVGRHENLLLVRTMSKSAALAGMRIGYAIGQPELIEALDVVKDSYNLDRLAIAAAVAAIEDREHRAGLVAFVVGERQWLGERLARLGFTVTPSAANFLFVRPPEPFPAVAVYEGLRRRRVLVRHYDRAPIDGWFRITIGTRPQHEALLAAIEEVMV